MTTVKEWLGIAGTPSFAHGLAPCKRPALERAVNDQNMLREAGIWIWKLTPVKIKRADV
jgi:hypothetical protein